MELDNLLSFFQKHHSKINSFVIHGPQGFGELWDWLHDNYVEIPGAMDGYDHAEVTGWITIYLWMCLKGTGDFYVRDDTELMYRLTGEYLIDIDEYEDRKSWYEEIFTPRFTDALDSFLKKVRRS